MRWALIEPQADAWGLQDFIKKTEDFYRKHGGKTVILARFCAHCAHLCPICGRCRQHALCRVRTWALELHITACMVYPRAHEIKNVCMMWLARAMGLDCVLWSSQSACHACTPGVCTHHWRPTQSLFLY